MKSINKTAVKYFLLFVFLSVLCFLFPYSGDDWAWGSIVGIERLETWFDNYSGRYLGNLIVLALTRSELLKTVAMSSCMTAIVYMISRLTKNHKTVFYITLLCFALMPTVVFRQSFVWTSGFANYTTSICFTLIYICYINSMYGDEKPKYSKFAILPLFILGAANTLIVEHLTIYNVCLALYAIIFCVIKFKKVYIQHIAYLAGTIFGTALMFSNSVYSSVATGEDGYRTIGSNAGIIAKAVDSYLNIIIMEGVLNNLAIVFLLAVACFFVFRQNKSKMSKGQLIASEISLFVIIGYVACSLYNILGSSAYQLQLQIEGALTVFYGVSLFVFFSAQPTDTSKKARILFTIASIALVMAPLLVVSPIGSRCFFASYVLFIYLIGQAFMLLDKSKIKAMDKSIGYLKTIVIVCYLYLLFIYGTIYACDSDRIEKAKLAAENGAEIIEIENLPYSEYVWDSTPKSGSILEERFKYFHDIDQSIKIKNIENHLATELKESRNLDE